MEINYLSKITLYPLKARADKKNYIVEDLSNDEFYEMPKVCVDAIELINSGFDLEYIEQNLKKTHPEEDVNIIEFVKQLADLELIKEINGEAVDRSEGTTSPTGYKWIPPLVGKFFFNKYTAGIHIGLIIVNITLLLINPYLFPHYQDIFIFDLMMENIVVWVLITFLLVLIHEFGHVLAVRAYDFPTKIELGHRLFFVVLETDMTKVWQLPPRKRNQLYFAGIYFDNILLFIALIGQMMPLNVVVKALLAIMVFDNVLRILYQFCIYMKTDFYYVLENVTGSYNLMDNGNQYLRKWFPFLPEDQSTEAFKGEEKLIRPYVFFYLIGIAVTIAVWFYYYLPQLKYAFNQITPGFSAPLGSIPFWDAIIFIIQFPIVIALLLYSWSKKYVHKQ
ncbi:hypothetical protein [Mesobacillus harenae]|uniref:hypothetical protein n=1 Tax=Mesobacillus harenae TaxID=2213203 RepID=UPI00157FE1D5|nr:hypothetical protein [Mesobacillus harenae]